MFYKHILHQNCEKCNMHSNFIAHFAAWTSLAGQPPPPSTRQAESASTGFAACNGPTWKRPPADPRPLLSPGSIPEVFRNDASRALVQLLLGSPHQKQLCYGHHSTFGLHSGPTHWFFKHLARDVHQPGTPLSPGGIPEVFRNCLLGEIVKLLLEA